MGWILTQFVSIVMQLVGELIDFFLGAFTSISMDIGINGTEEFGALFYPSNFAHAQGLLDKIFTGYDNDRALGAASFCKIFVFLGLTLTLFIGLMKIIQSMADSKGTNSENPMTIAGRMVLAGICVIYSYSIFTFVESFASVFYKLFCSEYELIKSQGILAANPFLSGNLFPDVGLLSSLGYSLVSLIFLLAMLMQFIRLILECFERYVLLGVMFYTSPLAFSLISTKETYKMFNSWLQMVISQLLLMMLNMFFIGGFYYAYGHLFSDTGTGTIFSSSGEYLATMCILIGWLTIGQKADQHLRSMGLSVAQTGEGLFRAIKEGLGITAATPFAISKINKGIGNIFNSIGGVKKAAYNSRVDKISKSIDAETGHGIVMLNGETTAREYAAGLGREGGHLTKDALKKLETPTVDQWHKPVEIKGPEANNAIKDNNLAQSSFTQNQIELAKDVSCSMGKYTATDKDGQPIFEAGSAEYYKPHEGEAYRTLQSEKTESEFVVPMTQDDITLASSAMVSKLSEDPSYQDCVWKRDFNKDGKAQGTATGFVNDEARYQAALSDVAKFEPSLGNISKTSEIRDGNYQFAVQTLDDPARTGYSEVLKPASVVNGSYLENKSQVERLSYANSMNEAGKSSIAKYVTTTNNEVKKAEVAKLNKPVSNVTEFVGEGLAKKQELTEKKHINESKK